MSTDEHGRIRSFVVRPGRITEGQRRALEAGLPRYGLAREDGPLDPVAAFDREAPLVMEIGFGMGQSLVDMAAAEPATDYLGIEVHRPGVGRLLHSMMERDVENIRVYCDDAVLVLEECITPASLDGIQIFFPDPWHKKRHHKRRLIQPAFVGLLCERLKPGGFLHLATDWENYAEHMLEVLSAEARLENRAGAGQYSPRPEHRPLTKFEQRGQRLGHGVWDLVFERRG
ncbi:MAG: tRNA (guanosine(46)-N7)-methyltransferase TrmB [Halieaceae bacterium]|nr:tRNA (guanosine(46)-N7)-methyltransferase TrmB [Halieaceae bacterium]